LRPYLEKTHHKKRVGAAVEGVDPEFKPQYCKKKKKERERKCHHVLLLGGGAVSLGPGSPSQGERGTEGCWGH
jgi:hypothetical protein